jgi:hypothetical protein
MSSADPADIRAWQRLADDVTTSGRLEPRDVGRLSALGVAHVINLALETHPEALADEGARLAAAGMAIPISRCHSTRLETRISPRFGLRWSRGRDRCTCIAS